MGSGAFCQPYVCCTGSLVGLEERSCFHVNLMWCDMLVDGLVCHGQVVLQSPFVDVPGGPTLSNSAATYMTAMGPMASNVSGPSLQQQQQQMQQLQSNEHSSMMGQQHSHQQQQLAGPIPTMESGVGQQGMSHLQQGMSHQQQMAQQMQAMSQGFSQSVFQSQKQVELDSERDPRQDRCT